MKTWMILFSLIFFLPIFAQHQNDSSIKNSFTQDSLNETRKSDQLYELNSYFPSLHRKYLSFDYQFSEPQIPYSVWFLNKPGMFESNMYPPLLQKNDMLRTYKMLYGKDDGIQTLQMILGMAQTTAVGIMAYYHIKKYGFK